MTPEQKIIFDDFSNKIKQLFDPKEIEDLAKESKFVQRESTLTGHLFLTIFVFGVSIYTNPTLEQLVGLLNTMCPEINITRQSLHERINQYAVSFFTFFLSKVVQLEVIKDFDPASLTHFNRILLLDSTSFQLPAELAELFPGCGGSASEAGMKIQFGYDLKSSQFFYEIQEGTSPDNKNSNSFAQEVEKGDLRIADLGYAISQAFVEIDDQEAFYLSRYKSSITLYLRQGEDFVPFDLTSFLLSIYILHEIEVYIKYGTEYRLVRLVAQRVPEDVKNQRIRNLNKAAKKKGTNIKKITLLLQGYNLYVSNAPEEALPMTYFHLLYSIRWGVELIFKNWKSNLDLSTITATREERVLSVIYAKMIWIFISHKISFLARSYAWLNKKREVSIYRATKYLKVFSHQWLSSIVKGKIAPDFLQEPFSFIIKHCLKTKSKKRIYPLEILELLNFSTLASQPE